MEQRTKHFVLTPAVAYNATTGQVSMQGIGGANVVRGYNVVWGANMVWGASSTDASYSIGNIVIEP